MSTEQTRIPGAEFINRDTVGERQGSNILQVNLYKDEGSVMVA